MMLSRRPFPTRSPRRNTTEQLSGQHFASFSILTEGTLARKARLISQAIFEVLRALFFVRNSQGRRNSNCRFCSKLFQIGSDAAFSCKCHPMCCHYLSGSPCDDKLLGAEKCRSPFRTCEISIPIGLTTLALAEEAARD